MLVKPLKLNFFFLLIYDFINFQLHLILSNSKIIKFNYILDRCEII